MRALILLMAAAGLSAEAPPQPLLQQFEESLSKSDFNAASAALDKLIELRTPADGKPRPDPVLNALMGRLYLAARDVNSAATYLDRASTTDLPAPLRVPTALSRGRAHEVLGQRTAALNAYREAAASSSTETDRRRAALGTAMALLPDDPAAARRQVLAIANGPPALDRWEAQFVLALASSILGDREAANKLADDAWTNSASAGLRDLAPLRVAILRAGLAAARHDVQAERAMLTVGGGVKASASAALAAQLPVCGDAGIQPSDYVIFGFVTGPYGTRQLFPIAANRLQVIAPFQHALDGIVPIKAVDEGPVGTIFTVSCRTVVSADYLAVTENSDPMLDWIVEAGIYPASASREADDKHLNAIADRIDALAARFGKDSPLLIGPRWQMMMLLEKRGRSGDQVLPGQLIDLGKQISQGLTKAKAPDWLARTIEVRAEYERVTAAAVADPEQGSAALALWRDQVLRTPFPFARQYLVEMLIKLGAALPPPVAQTVLDINDNAPSTLRGRDRQAWLLTLAHARRSLGQDSEARSVLESGGFDTSLCALNDSAPNLLEQRFSDSDYPGDLIVGEQEGSVAFEYDLTSTGSIARPRLLYSLPSGLFDEVTKKGLGQIRYTPPTRSGKSATCRAIVQTIRWRIGDEDDFSLPTFAPAPSPPTT